ncbi:hypothetical protein BDA99DRAFT_565387 [Phascolomyces articulosus]|uniref:Transmembrane protein n=1 Tax=Phascolomyces articulosus TaxID=60185 RepID=A0AAD5JNX8_9FUNG|nr:hypothetical protein BDA99DRAFT_565387 [Phascolomyces articulosus]
MALTLTAVEAQLHGGGTTTTTKNKKISFSDNPILANGTLFYIAISISFTLWCTGRGLDYMMDRHEQQANTRAFQKYNNHTQQEVY